MNAPTMFLVTGADGRAVGRYTGDELAAFKHRIRRNVAQEPQAQFGGDPSRRIPPERFTIQGFDAAGRPAGPAETWEPLIVSGPAAAGSEIRVDGIKRSAS